MGDNNTQKMMTSNETRLTVATTDLIISECLSFNIYQKPSFKKVLDLAKTVSKSHQPPNINILYMDLLGVIHDQNMERNLSLIKKESDIFGFLFLGDGATFSRIPLLKKLVSGRNLTVSLLELVDFQGHLADGRKRDRSFICTRFLENIGKSDPHKSITDVVMFDGA